MAARKAATEAQWLENIGRGLKSQRSGNRAWRLSLIDGPNMSNLGARDPRTYGTIRSLNDLHRAVGGLAKGLGVVLSAFTSNHEGELLKHIYGMADKTDAFLINPAGLNSRGEPSAQALSDAGKPYIELHFANVAASGWPRGTIVSERCTGVVMGLRQYSYISAVFGLVLALDSGTVKP